MTATWSRRRPKECYISIVPHLFLSVALALFPQSACAPTASPSTENITITVPQGTRNHGNPRLFCTPSKWTHIAKFFLANVVAHAATVKSVPGELTLPYLWSLVSAVVFPALGIVRGLSAIHQRAALAETPLETAARARALCMVVRMPDWRPQTGDIVEALEYGDVTNKPAFVFETTKEKRVIDGEDWNWIRIDRVPTKVNSGPWKIVFLLGKLFRLFSPRREDLESSEIPALMVRSKGPAARAIGDPCFVPSSSILGTGVRKAHGTCQLPQGYALSTVSPGTQVIGLDEDQHNGKFTGNSWYSHLTTTLSSK